jgi:hypothetical protein
MKEPSKHEVMGYVADMAEQLAAMCSQHDRLVSSILRGAAQIARNPKKSERKRR